MSKKSLEEIQALHQRRCDKPLRNNDALQRNNDQHQRRYDDPQGNNGELQQKFDQRQRRSGEIQIIYDKPLRNNDALQRNNDQHQRRYDDPQGNNGELQQKFDQHQRRSDKPLRNNDELQRNNDQHQRRYEELQRKNDELQRRCEELQKNKGELQKIFGELQGIKEKLQGNNDEPQRRFEELQKRCDELQRNNEELKEEIDRRKAQYILDWRKAALYPDWRKEEFQAVNVTLDADTAHPSLFLSEQRRVTWKEAWKDLPASPQRFDSLPCVLGDLSITSGRYYWEVDIGDAVSCDLGICRDNVTRKGIVTISPQNGFWAIRIYEGEYWALTSPETRLTLRVSPCRVGIFLDYEDGEVSFYNMTDGSHIYTFTQILFQGALRPLLGLCNSDSGTLTIVH
uniref:Enterocytin n=1 Tax=Oryctolagus cuniculus TaxID=9986 RepID=Q8SPQ3_RABIT|nr:enterocytin [Oryctolagus cuniculus]AAL85953.1 enterocytin [Oryctolagus cuniculus]